MNCVGENTYLMTRTLVEERRSGGTRVLNETIWLSDQAERIPYDPPPVSEEQRMSETMRMMG